MEHTQAQRDPAMESMPGVPALSEPRLVLSVGADTTLLSTRTQVMRQAGYKVEQITNLAAARRGLRSRSFDLVVLCHSVSRNERERLRAEIAKLQPNLPILFVSDGTGLTTGDQVVSAWDGPAALLRCMDALLHPPAHHS